MFERIMGILRRYFVRILFFTGRWPIYMGAVMLLIQGGLMLFSPDAGNATSTTPIRILLQQASLAGVALIVCGLLALVPHFFAPLNKPPSALWIMPQQFMVWGAGVASLSAVINQQYGDGVLRPWEFILADQAPYLVLTLFHSISFVFAMIQHDYFVRNGTS